MKIFRSRRVEEIKILRDTIDLLSKCNKAMSEEISIRQRELNMLNASFDKLKKDKNYILRKCNKYKKENDKLKEKNVGLMEDK